MARKTQPKYAKGTDGTTFYFSKPIMELDDDPFVPDKINAYRQTPTYQWGIVDVERPEHLLLPRQPKKDEEPTKAWAVFDNPDEGINARTHLLRDRHVRITAFADHLELTEQLDPAQYRNPLSQNVITPAIAVTRALYRLRQNYRRASKDETKESIGDCINELEQTLTHEDWLNARELVSPLKDGGKASYCLRASEHDTNFFKTIINRLLTEIDFLRDKRHHENAERLIKLFEASKTRRK